MAGRIAYLGNIVTQGLVLDLDAAIKGSYPGTGSIWTDVSNNNNGTLTNGPTFTGSDYGAIVFDGVDDYVGTSNFSGSITDSFTIGSWVNFTNPNSPTFQKIFHAQSGSVGPYSEVNLDNYNGGSGNARYHFYTHRLDNTSTNDVLTSTFTITGSVWAYVVGVYDNSTKIKSLYINGIINNSGSTTNQITWPDSTTRIGNRSSIPEPLNGRISLVQLYNRALSSTEITQNFNALRGRYGI